MIKLNGIVITPTIFPDKTSQIWKIPEDLLSATEYKVVWEFENEAELIHVCQLGELLGYNADLYLPFLPYGRQDKEVGNDKTFALNTFIAIVDMFFNKVSTLDAHSTDLFPVYWKSIAPVNAICVAITETCCDAVCFPDKGAKKRYSDISLRQITLDKDRNQETGEILGLKVAENELFIKHARVLVVDDLCDGGRTFTEAAKLLYEKGAREVHLYTTHGIYSKGLEPLKQADIKRIFNGNGEVK